MPSILRRGRRSAVAAAAALATVVSGCAGGVGSAADGQAGGSGFTYGAGQDDVDTLLADLDPVTLSFQPGALSPDSPAAINATEFKDYIEERSGGKVTIDIVYGQAIAGHDELEDALNDGRVDLAYLVGIYFPEDFPTIDSYSRLSGYASAAPLTGEAVTAAMMTEAAWADDEHLGLLESKGLVPLSPLMSSGDYWMACGEEGSSADDWQGRQIRVASTAQTEIATSIGANPLSMEYGEAFEALQRGTVDCTFVQGQVAGSTGLMEAAPHVSHFADTRMIGATTAMNVAGATFAQLPLAYQQIIFDAEVANFHGALRNTMDSSHKAVLDSADAGGSITSLDPEVEQSMADQQGELIEDLIDSGRVPEDTHERMTALAEKWTTIVDEMGYQDGGTLEDLPEWYEPGDVDFRPLGERLMEESALAHRPE